MHQKTWKKILVLMLILALPLCMAACSGGDDGAGDDPVAPDVPPVDGTDGQGGQEPDHGEGPEEPSFVMLRQAMIETTDIAAVAYLGYFDQSYAELGAYLEDGGFLENHPEIAEITEASYIEHEGGELYCIVPADGNAEVTVYNWVVDESNDYMGAKGEVLFERENGKPFIVKCNVSEIMPNLCVEIVDCAGNVLEYVPSLNMMDGTLMKTETVPTVLDFTPYEALGYDYGFTLDHLAAAGTWRTGVYTVNGDLIEGGFYFGDSGDMEFCYAMEEGGVYEVFYEGTYYYAAGSEEEGYVPDDAVIFNLTLVEDNSDLQIARPHILTAMMCYKDPSDTHIYMNYEAGEYLFDIEVDYSYELEPTVG